MEKVETIIEPESTESNWKEIGNLAFQEKKYEEAVKAYTEGLKITPSDVSILSNRAITYLNLEFFSLALSDTETVLKIDPTHTKAMYRKVKALIGGKKYEPAIQFVLKNNHKDILNSYTPEKNLGEKLLAEATKLAEQSQFGNYNMAEIIKEQTFEHQVADFNIPLAAEVFKGYGRGLVVTEKIEGGELIIGSKAFAFIVERKHREMKPPPPEGTLPEIEDYSVDRTVAKKSLVEAIVEKVKKKKAPEETPVLYTLHAGVKLGNLSLDDSLNSADMERIIKIVDCNALCTNGRMTYGFKELMYGLWLFPSFINHSCYNGNCKWHMHGDFLVIRALRTIMPGEELRMSYISPGESLKTRQELLAPYEINCSCNLCQFQANESSETQTKLELILKKYETLITGPGSIVSTDTDEFESIVEELEGIHPTHHDYCPFLLEPYKLLARRYFRKGAYEKSIEILEKGRKLFIGTDFTEDVITFTTNIISAYLKNKNKPKAMEWVKKLRRDLQIGYGEPVDDILQVIAPDLLVKLKHEKISVIGENESTAT